MINHEKVEQAVRLLLEGIGEDVTPGGAILTLQTGLQECMKRYTAAWKKMQLNAFVQDIYSRQQ